MTNDSSLSENAGQFAFDLESQKGVMHLLASVRSSEISSDQKNELRDLIFLYTNGGRDQSTRITIEQKVTAYGIRPAANFSSNVSTKEKVVHPYGASRPAPTFSPVKEPASKAETAAPVSPQAVPAPQPQPATPAQPAPQPPQAQAARPAPPTPPVTESVPVQPAPTPAPAQPPVEPVVQSQPAPEPTPTTYDPSQPLARIREIKSLVNEKVGNPVNLIDIDNEVGREYMSALLEAMKKLNSGTSVMGAMERLEKAYQAVEVTIKKHQENPTAKAATTATDEIPATLPTEPTPQKAAPVPSPEPSTETQPARPESTQPEPAPQEAAPSAPEMSSPVSDVVEDKEEPVSGFSSVEPSDFENVEPSSLLNSEKEVQPVKPVARVAPAGAPAPVPAPRTRSVEEAESAWGPATDTIRPEEKSGFETNQKGKLASLAEEKKQLKSINELPEASSLETSSVAGDPLFTKEVDEGLQQLLSEWSLFKKSGLFGTGPKGREHPLFKKISGLQIPLLLAGRFEGATQEIKQSITDYMNGWRYEQGIIYQQGETFEHYLRRVIRHILDLQKSKRPS